LYNFNVYSFKYTQYIDYIFLKQDNKHSRTHLGELDGNLATGKVHRTLTTAHENTKKIQNKKIKCLTIIEKLYVAKA